MSFFPSFHPAIEAEPSTASYVSNRTAAYISAHRFEDALTDALRADYLDPGNEKILFRLARIYTFLGHPSKALEIYSRIPDSPAITRERQVAAKMLRDIELADDALRNDPGGNRALYQLDQANKALGPGVAVPREWTLKRISAYLKMGTAKNNVNALGEAQNIVRNMLRENAQDPDVLTLRGRIFYQQGEYDQAIRHFKRALDMDPDSSSTIKHLRQVQKILRLKESGNTAFKSRRYQESIDIYTQALEIDPTNPNMNSKLLQNRAAAYLNAKQPELAVKDCDRALELDPAYLRARRVRAKAVGQTGDWETAVKDLKAIAEENPSEAGLAEEIRHAELELKKSKRKDHYKTLGVEKTATETEIKKAYRKKAIQYHPDKNMGANRDASDAMFKEIGEAYETLSDAKKREAYDSGADLIDPSDMFSGGATGGMGGMGGMGGGGVHINPEMLFNMMNGGGGGFASSSGGFGRGGGGGGFGRGGGFQSNPFGSDW